MSETKRTKAPSARRSAKGSAAAVLEQEPPMASALDGIDGLDDILGEIAPPPQPDAADEFDDILSEIAEPAKAEPVDALDDILSEIAEPAKAEPVDALDDILSELAEPAKAEPVDALDDILSELAEPAKAEPVDAFDDILSEIAGPAKAAPADDFDDILSEVAGPAVAPVPAAGEAKAKGARKRAAPAPEQDDLSALLDEMAPPQPPPAPTEAASADAAKAPGIGAKATKLAGSALSPFQGKREISRKGYFGLLGAIGVLALTSIGQAAFILTRPAAAPAGHGPAAHGEHAEPPAIPLVPVDYSKMDLARYRDKERSLGEGGRDMLRNPAIKEAVIALDNGETLYEELRKLSRLSKAADLVDIRADRLTINSCNLAVCTDKSFKLVYDLQRETASVCVTEKYLNGAYLSYNYGPEGYREVPSCNGAG